MFIWDEQTIVDKTAGKFFNKSKAGTGRETNYIEVENSGHDDCSTNKDEKMTVADYFN